MNWKVRLALWLGRRAGVDLRPWNESLEYAKSQIETLTLTITRITAAFHHARDAQRTAEAAYRELAEGKHVVAPQAVWDLVPLARELSAAIDASAAEGTSGEYKRHVVLAELQKRVPKAKQRDIALAIELALRPDVSA